jgi:hypothetical protein
MTPAFDEWVKSLRDNEDSSDPGELAVGTADFLRELYDSNGAMSLDDVVDARDERLLSLARTAVDLLVADIRHTTDLQTPKFKIRLEEGTVIVSYKGSYNAPALRSLRPPEAICEVVENVRDHIMDDLWAAWPLCPVHQVGLYAEPIDGRAAWYCRLGQHSVAPVGELGARTP